MLGVLREPPVDALSAASLELVRATAVGVSWLSAFGWPLYVYRRRLDQPRPGTNAGAPSPAVVVDETFAAAAENSTWFSMV